MRSQFFVFFLAFASATVHHMPRKAVDTTSVVTHWFTQQLSHKKPAAGTFQQRYYLNTQYFDPDGSERVMVVNLGGEGPQEPGTVEFPSVELDIVKEHAAVYLSIEHRFYGESLPTSGLTLSNLQYLNVFEALHDFGNIIVAVGQHKYNITQVVTSGCSYSGAMSSWMRETFPQFVTVALSGCSPVLALADFYQYGQKCDSVLGTVSSGCQERTRYWMHEIQYDIFGNNSTQKKLISDTFNACRTITTQLEASTFWNTWLTWIATLIQYSGVPDFLPSWSEYCEDFMKVPNERDAIYSFWKRQADNILPKVIKPVSLVQPCIVSNFTEVVYQQYINPLNNQSGGRSFYWQECQELGWFQYGPPSKNMDNSSLYISAFTGDWFNQACVRSFDFPSNYHEPPQLAAFNAKHGGQHPMQGKEKNVIYINNHEQGLWSTLSITSNLSNSVAVLYTGTGHCTYDYVPAVTPSAAAAQAAIKAQVTTWLHEDSLSRAK